MPLITTIHGQPVEIPDEERTECEVWTRVMGYYRPVSEFNIGKKSEHAERKFFSEGVIREHLQNEHRVEENRE